MIIKRGNIYCTCGALKLTAHGAVDHYSKHCLSCKEERQRAIRGGFASGMVFRGRTYGLFDRAEARKE